MILFSNILGLLGVFITLLAYFLLNIHKISSRSLLYSILNATGSALVIYSLFYAWNLPAFIMEFIWLLISFYAIYGAILLRRRKHDPLQVQRLPEDDSA